MRAAKIVVGAAIGLALGTASARAEPALLSRQYARCTTCHYSPTGGGLLTPYGRSLSRQELSTFGRGDPGTKGKEETALYGLLGDTLGPVQVGIDVRPAHLHLDFGEVGTSRDIFMTGDLLAAYRVNGWTVYGEVGREPLLSGAKIDSYEYWVAHETPKGLGFRAGRFLPAYGIRLADHTAFTRVNLGLDSYDQVYGLEVSQTWDHHLLQLSVGPGRADSVLHDDGRQAFTATGRFQFDLGPSSVLVASGLYRNQSRIDARNGAGGLAFGFSPTKRLTIWSEGDAQFRQGSPGAPAYTLLNETSFEVFRGIWLKFSPQLHTEYGDTSGGVVRMLFEVNLLPRTHWNIDVSFYRDRSRASDLVTKIFLAQLHLYL